MGSFGLTPLLLPLVVVVLFLALLPAAGLLYQWTGLRRDARRFPPPGRLVDIGGCRLHVRRAGSHGPAVVFEAGIAASSLSWLLVESEIARFARTVSYDRAGLGWSEPAAAPRGVWQVVDELRSLLELEAIPSPRILVAHSYGGLVARAYAARYPAEIAGMVLVDPVAISEWADPSAFHRRLLRRGVLLSRRGAQLARFGVVRLALALLTGGSRVLPQRIARLTSGGGTGLIERMIGEIRKLPREVWPMIQAHWCESRCFEGMARYLESLPESAAEVARAEKPGDLPLVVLSAGDSTPAQRAEHERLARLSSRARIEFFPASGHWIQLNRPDAVIRAAGEIAMLVQAGAGNPE